MIHLLIKTYEKSKKFLLLFFIRFTGLFLQFALNIIIARLLGTAGAGIYSVYTSWFNLISNLISCGLPQLSMRSVSVLYSEKKFFEIIYFIKKSSLVFIALGLLSFLVFLVFGTEAAEWLSGGGANAHVLQLSAIAAIAFVFLRFLSEILKAVNKINTAMTIDSFFLPLLLVIAIYAIDYFASHSKIDYFMAAHIGILVLLSYISWVHCKKEVCQQDSNPVHKHHSFINKKALVSFWLSSILGMWFLSMPLLVAPAFSSIHETGIFSASYRLITIIVNVLNILAGIYGPKFARNYNTKNYPELYKDLKLTAYISIAAYIPLFLVFIFLSDPILRIFGDDFVAGSTWLHIMALGQLIYSATGLVGLMMNMIHREKMELLIMVVCSVGMFILMLVLGYFYSITGIAFAFAAGLAMKNLVSFYFVRKILKSLIMENKPSLAVA